MNGNSSRSWTPRRFGTRLLLPIGALIALTLLVGGGFVWFSARTQDTLARELSEGAVDDTLQSRAAQLGRVVKDYAWWNDAVRYLDLDLDADWADVNIGGYVHETHGYQLSLVVDRADNVTYASVADGEEGMVVPTGGDLPPGLQSLLSQTRASSEADPAFASGVIALGDHLAIAAVCALTPEEDGSVVVPPGPRAVLVFVKLLDGPFLGDIANLFHLNDLEIRGSGDTVPSDLAEVALSNPDGAVLGSLVWQPERPGWRLIQEIGPSFALIVLLILVCTGIVLLYARRATLALEASEARFRDVADVSSDWIWETDSRLFVRFLSRQFSTVMSMPAERVIGSPIGTFLKPVGDGEAWAELARAGSSHKPFRNLICTQEIGGDRMRTLRVSGVPILGPSGTHAGYRGTATDISASVEAEKRARFLALHDPLTELPNRVLFDDRLEQAIAQAGRGGTLAAVLCIDLDRFKEVNDSFGHAAGDQLLKSCAERIRACIRQEDTLARISGDEFIVIQVGIADREDARRLCLRILDRMRRPFDLDGHKLLVSVSIGVALIPVDGAQPELIRQSADLALYRAKDEGRKTYRFFEAGMDDHLNRRRALEADLRDALAHGQFVLVFQPRIDATTGRLQAVEALLRWQHPVHGLLLPADFLAIAEGNGFILELSAWVLKEACSIVSRYPSLTVAVNISPVQFQQRSVLTTVRAALTETGLPVDRLELDVPETVMASHSELAITKLDQLRALGVRLTFDRFGAGVASLSQLQRFAFSQLTIDRSLIREAENRRSAAAIVRSIIGVAHGLDMLVCAQGVESVEQAIALRHAGCDRLQGALFGQPVPADELPTLLQRDYAMIQSRIGHLPAAS
ncbi:bifunctional diguanylate cyclase/phosphodiesterase [Marinivivus vitaminiproducens]|uniref:bifunctional diguanylate cyclase/phosphodiesterase n=1 Tax=Marinivivus vitaminiproducens TaxID=3035935 RepID=UPI0027A8ACB8|nr:EAL domain-containing protein [Geminicoccaceae bacterium SCSIO 64248]